MASTESNLQLENVKQTSFRIARLSLWQGNLLVIGLLVLCTLGSYFWQIHKLETKFLGHFLQDTKLLAEVIKRSTANTELSRRVIQEIVGTFLANNARFIDYLQDIKPFSVEELQAFAQENGLKGVTIISERGTITSGPPNWLAEPFQDCASFKQPLQLDSSRNIYRYTLPRLDGGCIVVGFAAKGLEQLEQSVSSESLLRTIQDLPAIERVTLQTKPASTLHTGQASARFLQKNNEQLALAVLPLGQQTLHLELNTQHYELTSRQIRQEFFLFVGALLVLGGVSTWMLFRLQQRSLRQARGFERRLAEEKEAAALGRATATLAHEIKNPLNSISMGLQRLQLETLAPDQQQKLFGVLLQAVQRTNTIVNDLRSYASPRPTNLRRIDLLPILSGVISLHQEEFRKQEIELDFDLPEVLMTNGDPDRLSELFENLIQNTLEAQPSGGYFRVRASLTSKIIDCTLANPIGSLNQQQAEQFFDPYFTMKTRGTGLGLTIARRIALGHEGSLRAAFSNNEIVFRLQLPAAVQAAS